MDERFPSDNGPDMTNHQENCTHTPAEVSCMSRFRGGPRGLHPPHPTPPFFLSIFFNLKWTLFQVILCSHYKDVFKYMLWVWSDIMLAPNFFRPPVSEFSVTLLELVFLLSDLHAFPWMLVLRIWEWCNFKTIVLLIIFIIPISCLLKSIFVLEGAVIYRL